MAYGGESNAKRLARLSLWSGIKRVQWRNDPERVKRILVLAGPEAADIRTLRYLGIEPSKITAVDTNPVHIESCKAMEPDATYIVGDVFEHLKTCKARELKYDALFLDFCQTFSMPLMHKVVTGSIQGLAPNATLCLGAMYGRERPETLKRMTKAGKAHARRSGFAWMNLDHAAYQSRMVSMMIGTISYRSGRLVRGKSVGVPMVYVLFASRIMRRPAGKLAWPDINDKFRRETEARLENTLGHNCVLIEEIGDDADGEKLKAKVFRMADRGVSSKQIALALNLKSQQIAAWKAWRTVRDREEKAS